MTAPPARRLFYENSTIDFNSPSAEAGVGVGKADVWLTTFRARSWKRTKRPTCFDAMMIITCLSLLGVPAVRFPPPQQKC